MPALDFNNLYTPSPAQLAFHNATAPYRLIGGAMGGGKSKALCAEAINRSIQIPGNRGAIIRRNMTTLKRTTVVTFFQTLPPGLVASFNRTDMIVTLSNGSEILFLEADESRDPLFEKLKSLELGWFAIDEASEVPRAAFQILVSRLRWPAARGHYLGMLASNPEQCWIKDDFIDARKPGYAWFPFLPKDNPGLPPGYIDRLRCVFDELQQKKYIDGDWNITDDPLQVIPYSALRQCIATEEELAAAEGEESMGIDVAELGDDRTVFAHCRGPVCYRIESLSRLRIDQVAEIARARIIERNINADKVGVDAVGNGAGVWGILMGANLEVRRIIAGAAEVETENTAHHFANLKAQMWWALRAAVLDPNSGFRIPNSQSLIQDLTAPRYTIQAERLIAIESKDRLRSRIGRSTDEADALVIANWVRQTSTIREYNFGFLN